MFTDDNGTRWQYYLTLRCGDHVMPWLINGAGTRIMCSYCHHEEGISDREYIERIR
jgi:hypothetical protein